VDVVVIIQGKIKMFSSVMYIFNVYKNIVIYYIKVVLSRTKNNMFETLYKAFVTRVNFRNIFYNKGRVISSRSVADGFMRKLSNDKNNINIQSSNNFRILCCNAFKINRCDCVETCKKLEKNNNTFKCEITNKPKKAGNVDCNCELSCMVKKSETMNIHENS
jgi:hypothetical protein